MRENSILSLLSISMGTRGRLAWRKRKGVETRGGKGDRTTFSRSSPALAPPPPAPFPGVQLKSPPTYRRALLSERLEQASGRLSGIPIKKKASGGRWEEEKGFLSFSFLSSPARFLFPTFEPSLRYKEASAEERVRTLFSARVFLPNRRCFSTNIVAYRGNCFSW